EVKWSRRYYRDRDRYSTALFLDSVAFPCEVAEVVVRVPVATKARHAAVGGGVRAAPVKEDGDLTSTSGVRKTCRQRLPWTPRRIGAGRTCSSRRTPHGSRSWISTAVSACHPTSPRRRRRRRRRR